MCIQRCVRFALGQQSSGDTDALRRPFPLALSATAKLVRPPEMDDAEFWIEIFLRGDRLHKLQRSGCDRRRLGGLRCAVSILCESALADWAWLPEGMEVQGETAERAYRIFWDRICPLSRQSRRSFKRILRLGSLSLTVWFAHILHEISETVQRLWWCRLDRLVFHPQVQASSPLLCDSSQLLSRPRSFRLRSEDVGGSGGGATRVSCVSRGGDKGVLDIWTTESAIGPVSSIIRFARQGEGSG